MINHAQGAPPDLNDTNHSINMNSVEQFGKQFTSQNVSTEASQ